MFMAGSQREDTSAIPPDDSGTNGYETALRVAAVCLITVIVVAGLVGLLGVRTSVATAVGDGISVSVGHASITRAGLATPLSILVESVDGSPLPGTLTTRVGADYMELFDENGIDPEPTSTFRNRQWTWWTFEVPDGAPELEISFDARLEPAVQWGRSSTAAVEVGGVEVASVDFSTWVLP